MSFPPATRDKKPVVVWFNKSVLFRPRNELEAEIPSSDCVPAAYDLAHLEDLADDVELPRLLEKVEPDFPPGPNAERKEGEARFACVVDTCGRVRDCRVLNASLGEFARAGMNAVVRRRYAPARRNGRPITITFSIGVTFRVW